MGAWFWVVDIGPEGEPPGHGDDGKKDPKEGGGDVFGGGAGEGSAGPKGIGDEEQPQHLIEDFKQDDGQHQKWAKDAEAGDSGEGGPNAPDDGVGGFPGAVVGEDVGPGLATEDEEHEDIEETQEIDVEGADAVEAGCGLKEGQGAESHGDHLVCDGWVDEWG